MKINNIEYKVIPGYSDYYAGYDGTIYSSKSDKLKKLRVTRDGYLLVNLYDEEHKVHSELVHRLIALTWLPNPEDKPEVHHKDEDKTNNSVTNLAWVTSKENINAGSHNQRMIEKLSKSVVLTSVADGTKLYFPSIREAIRAGYAVSNVLAGNQKTTKGYYAEYTVV